MRTLKTRSNWLNEKQMCRGRVNVMSTLVEKFKKVSELVVIQHLLHGRLCPLWLHSLHRALLHPNTPMRGEAVTQQGEGTPLLADTNWLMFSSFLYVNPEIKTLAPFQQYWPLAHPCRISNKIPMHLSLWPDSRGNSYDCQVRINHCGFSSKSEILSVS